MDKELYAEVLVDIRARKLDQVFHYRVPPELGDRVQPGVRVLVPFNKIQLAGYVVGFSMPPEGFTAIRDIAGITAEDPVFTAGQLDLARWMAGYYLCSTVAALKTIIWPAIKGESRQVSVLYPVLVEGGKPAHGINTRKREAVWDAAYASPGLTRQELAAAACVSPAVVDGLRDAGLLSSEKIIRRRRPHKGDHSSGKRHFVLSRDQGEAVERVILALKNRQKAIFLLFGVTGSGKTEVYMRSIEAALAMNRQALVMVPEISLTPQMVSLFRGRFGDRVAVLHSALSDGERYDEWRRIADREASVVLGTRSAVFAPFYSIGLIVLDEEHENSYKQEETPRYQAREVAMRLAGRNDAILVLGSATPSLESYSRTFPGGPYTLLVLPERIEQRPLPQVRIVDMCREMKEGNPGIFSRVLIRALEDRIERGEQAILFLNRRGYATFISCRECGMPVKCPHCDISLTYHVDGRVYCHYCNYWTHTPTSCVQCGSKCIGYYGTGTQKVETEVGRLFPGVPVVRMDSDTTSVKGAHSRILNNFREGRASILIGTQMVAKGLDMPRVTLVGVINADITLHMPDFRAAERTFQLIAQVAGRAGRGSLGGEVIVQTLSPDHYAITYAAGFDYEGFFEREMRIRKALLYPPYTRMARVLATGASEDKVKEAVLAFASVLENPSDESLRVEVMGPAPAPLSRIRDRYRYHLIVRSRSGQVLREALDRAGRNVSGKRPGAVSLAVDIDPVNMM